MATDFNLGIIEGFYGKPWTWQTRKDYADFMLQQGYGAYIYGPKNDAKLREQWQQSWSEEQFCQLQQLSQVYRSKGIKFGIALSPYEVYQAWNATTRQALTAKLAEINQLQPDIVCILFDDMRGDVPDLAKNQAEIAAFMNDLIAAPEVILCPTYYSYDPVLEKIFGQQPKHYLQDLGAALLPEIDVFWTGPSVWSVSYPPEHLEEVADKLRRQPVIWDNYPVNDMKNWHLIFLHAFKDRLAQMPSLTRGHFVNPMNQAQLSKIPLMTLPQLYREGAKYNPQQALIKAIKTLAPGQLGQHLLADADGLAEQGFNQLSEPQKAAMLERYQQQLPLAMAQEMVDWLTGKYTFDKTKVQLWEQE
ncbi:beta-N-acetylglucosaminidase domain-containing protein [Motilimonas pumila]|uniref:Hyaluronidase n=1 Tax=Motilimonas pumila TaxID=2303987 RepID=A0A418YCT9_9GAMM|nr:beta-N-acetylglucosaminidase domain-containing protein [Motilimonas pumila]RJG42315.1 hyaluronidase [Motilimonas pumila]